MLELVFNPNHELDLAGVCMQPPIGMILFSNQTMQSLHKLVQHQALLMHSYRENSNNSSLERMYFVKHGAQGLLFKCPNRQDDSTKLCCSKVVTFMLVSVKQNYVLL